MSGGFGRFVADLNAATSIVWPLSTPSSRGSDPARRQPDTDAAVTGVGGVIRPGATAHRLADRPNLCVDPRPAVGRRRLPTTSTTQARLGARRRARLIVASLVVQLVGGSLGDTDAAPSPVLALSSSANGIAIAVLPLANLSGDEAQEFFSDGMTDEITSALAKVPNLRVVGRSSAFQFKDQSKDLRAIGEALSATYLIDGSVRRAGNRVRVTAQLVRAEDGLNLWTDNYDRELTDVVRDRRGHRTGHRGGAARAAWIGRGRAPRLVPHDRRRFLSGLPAWSGVRARPERRGRDRHARKRRRPRPELRAGLGDVGAGLPSLTGLQRRRAPHRCPSR